MNLEQVIRKMEVNKSYLENGAGYLSKKFNCRPDIIKEAKQIIRNKRKTPEINEDLFKEFLEYIDSTEEEFWESIDKHRSPHIWKKEDGKWKLRKMVKA